MDPSQIICHRGYWDDHSFPPNSLESFSRAFENGYGVETDIRNIGETIIIGHDIADNECTLNDFFHAYSAFESSSSYPASLLLNIKADGLAASITNLLDKFRIQQYFCFDMSVPETLSYEKHNLNYLVRFSEYEDNTVLIRSLNPMGIWVDSFHGKLYDNEALTDLADVASNLFIVSPELHKRSITDDYLAWLDVLHGKIGMNLKVCTDVPQFYA